MSRRQGSRLIILTVTLMLGFPLTSAALQPDERSTPDTLPWTWTLGAYRETTTITVDQDELTVEIADDSSLRARGLSYRDGLAPGTGMLFVYPDEEERSFWMRGMRFCLDIVWISDGRIVGAAKYACPEPGVSEADLARYLSPVPVQFVLEVPAGWLDARGYGPGTPVDLNGFEN